MAVKRGPRPHSSTHQARGRQQRQLRIIAGQWRGRRFRFPELDIRPTPDRVRETLFNWLQTRIEGAHCLDLYAGSGALGLEALSRGAASVVFVEHQRLAADALQRLLRDWQASAATVVCDEALHYLAARRARGAPGAPPGTSERGFDLVFLDPPYGSGELPAAAAALAHSGLAPEALIYVEQHADDELQQALPASWRQLRTGKAGEVRYHLYAA
ncbi:MAG: 16S rRNA (guanine(966)-N(2))-methyltransferase RsmD [Steroidobacterales bacterium]